jgi:5-oxopent-3-ene-1,2,5-tricarboxylate decarboxylase / 2-hydroxyhepta-2,4-diene-1,7-dioate isomerase
LTSDRIQVTTTCQPPKERHVIAEQRIIEQLGQCSVATITHWLFGKGYQHVFMRGLTCLREDLRLVGRARTVRFVPVRPDLAGLFPDREENPHRKAVDHINAGEVLVVDAHGSSEGGIFGDIMSARLEARGAAGLVVDGGLRDVWQIKELELPTYVRHVHAAAVSRAVSAVEMDGIVSCAGVAVRPGDYLLGDPDGVVVVPVAMVEEAVAHALPHDQLEVFIRERVRAGAPLLGNYPPTEAVRAEYAARRGQG